MHVSAMASGVQVGGRTNPWLAIRAASMYFYMTHQGKGNPEGIFKKP